AAETLEKLPKIFKEKMSNVEIVLSDEEARKGKSVLLGLYQGVPVSERNTWYTGALPDKITLYRKNIEAACLDDAGIKKMIKDTIIHEVGHHFGLSEKEIRETGF
ncbi:MAG: metallopeptidase family protein, partial [Candidatus Firestonebacteria bacterium]